MYSIFSTMLVGATSPSQQPKQAQSSPFRTHLAPFFLALLLSFTAFLPTWALELDQLPAPPKTTHDAMWEIFLISSTHLITQELDVPMEYLQGHWMDARIVSSYQAMYQDAQAAGITLYLNSAYRSIATQSYLYRKGIERYQGYGYSYATAVEKASLYYAKPGGSEHHLGLALDLTTPAFRQANAILNDSFAKTTAYQWLSTHCHQYGFILRYPQGKTNITGIAFEPWHYRYVGVEHATYMTTHGLVLEEYIDLYQSHYPALFAPPVENTTPLTPLDPSLVIQKPAVNTNPAVYPDPDTRPQLYPGIIPSVIPGLLIQGILSASSPPDLSTEEHILVEPLLAFGKLTSYLVGKLC